MLFIVIFVILFGYLLGSFPTAYIVTRITKGIDIRDIDVGNVGAAATFRQVGLIAGFIVAITDIAKGALAIVIARYLFNLNDPWIFGVGFAALLGHCFPVYIGFRGGQGTATVIGIFLVLTPYVILILLCLIAILSFYTRKVFRTIVIAGPLLPVFTWFIYHSIATLIFSLIIIIFMSYRNRKGINTEVANMIINFKKIYNKQNTRRD
jgi:glycerol-3-phosphate acyltransferase PlsY